MNRFHLFSAVLATLFLSTNAHAQVPVSTFQNTCSNIHFSYQGNDAAINAVCLRADGTPNATSILIPGIGNDNGKLVQTGGASSFQQSCGNIQILVDGPDVTLYALCRTVRGNSLETSIPILGIDNNNGNLTN
ncbi:MAG: CVNH domain-containing protein [Pseudomonadota bacterium]